MHSKELDNFRFFLYTALFGNHCLTDFGFCPEKNGDDSQNKTGITK